jgi:hypothetical protein
MSLPESALDTFCKRSVMEGREEERNGVKGRQGRKKHRN